MIGKIGKERSTKDNLKLAGIFSIIAGYTNALSFLTVGFFVSHTTGTATLFGTNLSKLDFKFVQYALILLMFICGSILSSILMISYSKSISLVVEGFILSLIGLVPLPFSITPLSINLLPVFLSFAMGMQSAATTYLSSAIVRTTHLTGAATDIGIAIVKKDLKAFTILLTIISGFILGAIIGYFANSYLGIHGFLVPGAAVLLIGLSFL